MQRMLRLAAFVAAVASAASEEPASPYLLGGKGGAGSPLYLTPYIKSGNVTLGRAAASVPPLAGSVESYAGFLTVDEKLGSNLFFWFFPAEERGQQRDNRAPVILWLQGGPGHSSLYGVFGENGPLQVAPPDVVLLRGVTSWTSRYNMLYVDSPVGAGYSFTRKSGGYATSQEDVGRDLLIAVRQFFRLFPHLRKREFFVAGEAYGGKFATALARAIHKSKSTKPRINLKGVVIGNGWCDPESYLEADEYLFQTGLLDETGRDELKKKEAKIAKRIRKKRWTDAYNQYDELLVGAGGVNSGGKQTSFTKRTGYTYAGDLLRTELPAELLLFEPLVQKAAVRRALHVGDAKWNSGGAEVLKRLRKDYMQSAAPWIADLLRHYRFLFYSGQLDMTVTPPETDRFIRRMPWSGARRWNRAPRRIWRERERGRVAGYAKTVKRLTHVVVIGAGQSAPAGQPARILDALNRFVDKQAFG